MVLPCPSRCCIWDGHRHTDIIIRSESRKKGLSFAVGNDHIPLIYACDMDGMRPVFVFFYILLSLAMFPSVVLWMVVVRLGWLWLWVWIRANVPASSRVSKGLQCCRGTSGTQQRVSVRIATFYSVWLAGDGLNISGRLQEERQEVEGKENTRASACGSTVYI